MTIEVRVPQLPESVADATLVAWHKKPGDSVRRDENLADLETDKVVLEVPAPADGILRELSAATGAVVTSGVLLALIDEGAITSSSAKGVSASDSPSSEAAMTSTADASDGTASTKVAPAARRMLDEKKMSTSDVSGSGRDGRVSKQDVVRAPQAPPLAQAVMVALSSACR